MIPLPTLLLPEPGCVTWPLNLAVTAATKAERQVVSPSDLEHCSAGPGCPIQKEQSFSTVPPCTLYATTVARPVPRAQLLLPIQTQAYLQTVLEVISEEKQYSFSLSLLFSLSKTHLPKLKRNMSSGVNRNPA